MTITQRRDGCAVRCRGSFQGLVANRIGLVFDVQRNISGPRAAFNMEYSIIQSTLCQDKILFWESDSAASHLIVR